MVGSNTLNELSRYKQKISEDIYKEDREGSQKSLRGIDAVEVVENAISSDRKQFFKTNYSVMIPSRAFKT